MALVESLLETADPGDMMINLKAAREAFTDAVANLNIMQHLLDQTDDLFSS